MDELIRRHKLSTIHFLKMDIEGSEFDLLCGDTQWLSRVEKIAMEIHPEFGDVEDATARLRRAGFTVQLVDNRRKRVSRIQDKSGYLFAQRI